MEEEIASRIFWFGILSGTGVLSLFAGLISKTKKLDAPLLGLLSLSILLLGLGIIRPKTIEYGSMKFVLEQAERANKRAEEATRMALEMTAMLAWNEGRFGAGVPQGEKLATDILKDLHGSKAIQYRNALQHMGILLTPESQLKNVPKTSIPKGIDSPLYEKFIKDLKGLKSDNPQ